MAFDRLVIILIAVTFAGNSRAYEVTAKFQSDDVNIFSTSYRVIIEDLKCSSDKLTKQPLPCTDSEVVTGIKSLPESDYNKEMVKFLRINDQSIYFMPSGFANFFPSVVALSVVNSNLKVIRKRDLGPFNMLVSLMLYGNRLESLDLDVFHENPKLSFIDLSNNDFKYLDWKTFEPLTKLLVLDLSSNHCINMKAKNATAMADLKTEIDLKCKTVGNFVHEEITALVNLIKYESLRLESEIKALKEFVTHLVDRQ